MARQELSLDAAEAGEHDLLTPRLRLRAPRGGDAGAISALSDLQVARMTTRVPYPNPPAEVRAALEAMGRNGELRLAICDRRTDEVLGMCGVSGRGVGYWLGAAHRGRGLAREVVAALLIHHFGAGRETAMEAGVFVDNPASIRVLTRLGFRRTGRARERSVGRGGEVEAVLLELSRDGWRRAQAMTLVTPRLVMTPLGAEDAEDFAALVELSASRQTATLPREMDAAGAAARIAARAFRGRPGFSLGLRHDGRLIGEIGLGGETPAPSVMIWLGKDWRGRGLGREAMEAFLPAAMDRFDLPRLSADAFSDNLASRALLTRLGFVETGQGRGRSLSRARPAPVTDYALTREDFDAALTRAPAGGRSAA